MMSDETVSRLKHWRYLSLPVEARLRAALRVVDLVGPVVRVFLFAARKVCQNFAQANADP